MHSELGMLSHNATQCTALAEPLRCLTSQNQSFSNRGYVHLKCPQLGSIPAPNTSECDIKCLTADYCLAENISSVMTLFSARIHVLLLGTAELLTVYSIKSSATGCDDISSSDTPLSQLLLSPTSSVLPMRVLLRCATYGSRIHPPALELCVQIFQHPRKAVLPPKILQLALRLRVLLDTGHLMATLSPHGHL
ncbi:hypothetical protein AOLI_G00099690 [Acnodon oligacanthus]